MPTERARNNFLKQVVYDSKDQKWINIPKIEEKWLEKLWNVVEQAKKGSITFGLAPMEEIHADPNQCEFDADSICGYIGSIDEDLK